MNGTLKFKLVGLDSNIFIYLFDENPEFIKNCHLIFNLLDQGKLEAVTSIISVIEALSYPSTPSVLKAIQEGFKNISNLTVVEVGHGIGIEAAKIRREYGFRTPDAIQLATAKLSKANAYITTDHRLKNYKKLKVIILSELKPEEFEKIVGKKKV